MMVSQFEYLGKFFVNDSIVIINKKAVVCIDNKELRILNGNVESIIFHTDDWGVTLVAVDQQRSKYIYSMLLKHKLYRKLEMLAKLERIKQGNNNILKN